jgi:hypothetical protein
MSDHGSPVALLKFQIAPKLMLLISSGSKKKEPRYACLNEAKGSHLQRIGPRFLLSLHTSYRVECPAALVGEDFSSGCYVEYQL